MSAVVVKSLFPYGNHITLYILWCSMGHICTYTIKP